jgi:hypothetical protein
LSIDEIESLEENLAVLSSPGLMSDLNEALLDHDANATTPMSKAEAIAMLRQS